jgi:hypothetical protein
MGLWKVEAPSFSRQSAHRWWWGWGCEVIRLSSLTQTAALYPQEEIWQ